MIFKNKSFLKIAAVVGLAFTAAVILASSGMEDWGRTSESFETASFSHSKKVNVSHIALRDSLDIFGKSLLGIPYSYAGSSREGFDCSGFIYYVFKNFDINVPRSSSQFAEFGEEVAIDQVQKGDILVFLSPTRDEIGHLGIVTKPNGMETEFIHATSGKEMQVTISSLKQPGYNQRFVKAVSVIED